MYTPEPPPTASQPTAAYGSPVHGGAAHMGGALHSGTVPPGMLPPGGGQDLLAAFMRGAGMPGAQLAEPVEAMEALGAAFRAVVAGLRHALMARAAIKGEFRIEQTMIRARGNNPLKFSADDDDALAALLGIGRRKEMAASAAIAEALRDMQLHELASMAAMQSAVRALVDQFDPAKLRAAADQGSGLALVPAQRKARAWDAFETLHTRTANALADDFDSVFGKAFARAYRTGATRRGGESRRAMSDNPFLGPEPDDSERTVIRPRPGGRSSAAAAAPPPARAPAPPRTAAPSAPPATSAPRREPPMADEPAAPISDAGLATAAGLTPLVAAAMPLLQLLARLRNTAHNPNAGELRERVVRELRGFEQRARAAGVSAEQLQPAHYAICASLDDVVLNTPWGASSAWGTRSLVATMHSNARSDGHFELLAGMRETAGRDLPVLEIFLPLPLARVPGCLPRKAARRRRRSICCARRPAR